MIRKAETLTSELREHMRGGNGSVEFTPLMDPLPGNARLYATLTLAPGASIGYHEHVNETELFYFVRGTARVRDDGQVFELTAGDVMSTPSGHSHSVENIGIDELKLVAVIIKD